MLTALLTIPLVFTIITLFGYFMHYALHQKYMGQFYQSHLTHHVKLYPISDFKSLVYREAGKDNTTYVFLLFGSPLIIAPILLWWFGVITLPVFIAAMGSLAVFGLANNYLHDAFHITDHWALRFGWFKRLVELHYQHHLNVRSNYGIYFFGWDKVFGSYRSKQ